MVERIQAVLAAIATRAEGREFAFGVVLAALGLVLLRWHQLEELAYAVLFAGVAAFVLGLISLVVEERQRRLDAAEESARGRSEMRRIAELAREVLLETSVWTDIDEIKSWSDGQWANPAGELRPPREWSVAAIVGRGRDELDPVSVLGWPTMAASMRAHAQHLTNLVDQEFPGPPAERRSELRTVFLAAAAAADAADHLAEARRRVTDLHWGGAPEEKRVAADALEAAGHTFFGSLEWLEGSVERIEPTDELLDAIAASKGRHRETAAAAAAKRRELQAIAGASAEQLLLTAAPATEYLRRSTLGRDGTLHDIARQAHFAFAAADEVAALQDWLARVRAAQREFAAPVEGRGWDMSLTTHWLWVHVHNDGILDVERAIQQLQEDLARSSSVPATTDLSQMLDRSRARLHGAVRGLDERIAKLRTHEVR